jgi:hypothetical protein
VASIEMANLALKTKENEIGTRMETLAALKKKASVLGF